MITTSTAGNTNKNQTDYEKYAFGPRPGQVLWAETSPEYKRGYRRWELMKNVPAALIQDVLKFVAADGLALKDQDMACSVIERLIVEFAADQPRLRESEALMTKLFNIIGVCRYREEHQTQLRQDLGIYLTEVINRWVS